MSLDGIIVTEGVEGFYRYHLSSDAPHEFVRGLCGARTMRTSIPVASWGIPFGEHLVPRPKFCEKCAELAKGRE